MSVAKITGQWLIDTTDDLSFGELQDWLDQFPTSAISVPPTAITVLDDLLEVDLSDSAHTITRNPDAPDRHRNIHLALDTD